MQRKLQKKVGSAFEHIEARIIRKLKSSGLKIPAPRALEKIMIEVRDMGPGEAETILIIRKEFERWWARKKDLSGRVRQFLVDNEFVYRLKRRLMTHDEVMSSLPEYPVPGSVTPLPHQRVPLSDLTDGEIAAMLGRGVSKELVKNIRQRISKGND